MPDHLDDLRAAGQVRPLWRRALTNGAVVTALLWLLAELVGAVSKRTDDTLSEWTWDALGPRYGLRWSLIMGGLGGLAAWTWLHLGWGSRWDVPELLVLLACGVLLGALLHYV